MKKSQAGYTSEIIATIDLRISPSLMVSARQDI